MASCLKTRDYAIFVAFIVIFRNRCLVRWRICVRVSHRFTMFELFRFWSNHFTIISMRLSMWSVRLLVEAGFCLCVILNKLFFNIILFLNWRIVVTENHYTGFALRAFFPANTIETQISYFHRVGSKTAITAKCL